MTSAATRMISGRLSLSNIAIPVLTNRGCRSSIGSKKALRDKLIRSIAALPRLKRLKKARSEQHNHVLLDKLK
jgi:hypothetical protein